MTFKKFDSSIEKQAGSGQKVDFNPPGHPRIFGVPPGPPKFDPTVIYGTGPTWEAYHFWMHSEFSLLLLARNQLDDDHTSRPSLEKKVETIEELLMEKKTAVQCCSGLNHW
jgi:hypothetical protein